MGGRPALRALVLAAGHGVRLRPLTLELPKPLLPVAGRPLAGWSLERLRAAGCERAALNLHHRGDAIRERFGDSFGGLPLVYSEEPELLGTGGALPPLRGHFAGAGLAAVVNGDSLCRWPIERMLRVHRASGARATLLFHRTADPARFGGGVAVDAGRVVTFRRGEIAWAAARTRRVFAGAAILDPALVERVPEGPSDVISVLYEPMLAVGEPIAAVETSRAWFDLGTPARYLEGALAWGLRGLPERGARIAADATVDAAAKLRRVVVEAGATVGAGARLVETLVLPGATVGGGARLERALVGPGVTVGEGETVSGVLLTGSAGARVATPLAG